MKRKLLVTILSLIMGLSIVACGKQENTATTEPIVESTEVETTVTEETVATETTTETEFIDDTTVSDDSTSSTETTTTETGMNSSQPYYPSSTPCGNSQKQQAWNDFCNNWNESDYGTTTKGKTQNDFPYYGSTGYDASLIQDRTTDKGYKVKYDTATGRVYYTGMTLPTGRSWDDTESGGVLANYEISKGYNNFYDVTYAEMQEVLGVYNGD